MEEPITYEINEVSQYIELVSKLNEKDSPLWYRGHADASWEVQAAIWRERSGDRYTTADERNFTHRFRTRAAMRRPESRLSYNDHAPWLSLMQHYGLPTRLLDWSRSPLIAAYFAVQSYLNDDQAVDDAAIHVLAPHRMNEIQVGKTFTPAIDSASCDDWIKPAFTDHEIRERGDGYPRSFMAVMAAEFDIRMFVQQGCFTLHKPHSKPLDEVEGSGLRAKVVIPQDAVQRFAHQLHDLGFRDGDVFPDLEGLARELVRSHPPGSVDTEF